MTTLTPEQYTVLSLEEKLSRLDRLYQTQSELLKKIKESNEKLEHFNRNFEIKIVEI